MIGPNTPFPIQLTNNLTVVGNYYFNLYLFRGKSGSALVEMGISAVVDRVIEQLDALGTEPDYLVITHPHSDHITGLAGLMERYPGATVVAGAGAKEFATHPKGISTMIREDAFMASALTQRGIAPGRPPITGFSFPDNILEVDGETTIDLGGIRLHGLAASGHSPGGLLVHCPEARAVIVSDGLGFHFPGQCFLPLFFTGYADYLTTLKKIASLRPEIVGPGHQGPLTGPLAPKALDQACRATTDLLNRIVTDRRDDEDIAADLFREFYRDEFTLYSEKNIRGCCRLLVRRAREFSETA
ncbi:MAG: MBL fold metallo-hydrolase [Desulfobacterales bacterium]|nr:MBL fold metallo-hydrolase [Desulfobacterales bacterium]